MSITAYNIVWRRLINLPFLSIIIYGLTAELEKIAQ
jgi:hypothetical protein